MSELVTLTIDGRQVRVEPNTLLVEAAAQLGVLVPVYCYHPKLAPVGACRMCLVEVEGMPKLIASCTTPVKEGMVVQTQNARVKKARAGMLEFLLIHHPLDCPVCDKGGECPLQDYTYEFGPAKSRFRYPKRHWDKPLRIGKNILLDRERCIMCLRCVRFCQEISDHEEIGFFERGNNQVIGVVPGHSFDSQFSGNTVELCPVGALTAAPNRFFGRTWEIQHTPSICTGCATGCNIRIDHRGQNRVVRLWSRENSATDAGWLCDGGRFGYEFVNEARLTDFMVKEQGELVVATPQQAVVKAASIISTHAKNGDLGILASPIFTNEELWLARKLAHETLGTDNLDTTSASVNAELESLSDIVATAGFRAGVLGDIGTAKQIITIGVDLSNDQPVTELRVKQALFKRAADLVTLYPEDIELNKYARQVLTHTPGDEASLIQALADAVAGNESDDLVGSAGKLLSSDESKAVIIGWRLRKNKDAKALLQAMTALARALGPDVPCITIYPNCNSRGALDVGVSTAGGQVSKGLSGNEILCAARDGKIKALWLLGSEPLFDTDPELVKSALENCEVVYQGWSLRDLPSIPDVALATCTFAEQSGTFTNTDGRVQRIFPAIKPAGRTRPGWRVITDLARALGASWDFASEQGVWEELSREIPVYRDIQWDKIGTNGIQSSIAAPRALAETL